MYNYWIVTESGNTVYKTALFIIILSRLSYDGIGSDFTIGDDECSTTQLKPAADAAAAAAAVASRRRNSFHILHGRRWSCKQTGGHLEDKWDIISEQTCNRSWPFKRTWPLLPGAQTGSHRSGIRCNMPETVRTAVALNVSIYVPSCLTFLPLDAVVKYCR